MDTLVLSLISLDLAPLDLTLLCHGNNPIALAKIFI